MIGKMRRRTKALIAVLGLIALLTPLMVVFADGDETLGTPGIAISEGSGVVAAGIGLKFSQPGSINIEIPAGASVEQVLLYWEGQVRAPAPLPEIIQVNGGDVEGTLIGTSAFPGFGGEQVSFRADITDLGLISSGMNSIAISGLDFDVAGGSDDNNGAGLLVIIDDGFGPGFIDIRDGHDHAFLDTAVADPDYPVMAVQTFNFPASISDRAAELINFVADVDNTGRPNALVYTIDGVSTEIKDAFTQSDGPEWDTLVTPVVIPAGATAMEVQVLSGYVDGPGDNPESLQWIASTLTIEAVELPALARITGGGWRVTGVSGEDLRISQGFTLHCDILLSNNLQINWNGGQKWHINKTVDAAFCEDDPNYSPEPPAAPADTYIGVDMGKLNNSSEAIACFRLEDHGEGGHNPDGIEDGEDRAMIRIFDPSVGLTYADFDLESSDPCKLLSMPVDPGNTVLFVPLTDLAGGNLQFHFDQPHKGNKK